MDAKISIPIRISLFSFSSSEESIALIFSVSDRFGSFSFWFPNGIETKLNWRLKEFRNQHPCFYEIEFLFSKEKNGNCYPAGGIGNRFALYKCPKVV